LRAAVLYGGSVTPRSSILFTAAGLVLLLGTIGPRAADLSRGADGTAAEIVTINPNIRHQTIQGWGATHSLTRDLNFMSQETVDQMIDESVNDLGLTFLRVGFGLLVEPYNDNADPNSINWSAFYDGGSIDRDVVRGLGRFASQVRANGETPVFLFAKDWEFGAPEWMNEAEFSEHMTANMLYFKNQHGIDINFTAIDNEPEYFDPYTPERQRPIIKALGPMLQANGLATKIALNEGLNANSTWSYITALQSDAAVWPHIGLLNWHLYGTNDPFRSQIRDFGRSRGIPTAMTEFAGAQIRDLMDDLTLGGVSYWTRYFTADRGAGGVTGGSNYFAAPFDGTSFLKNHTYFQFRQFMRYVRPGAVRIEAASSTPAIRAFAFERAGSRVAVLVNTSGFPVEVTVQGLTGGRYGVSQTVGRNFAELGVQDIGGSITVTVAGSGILTIYPVSGNQSPVATEWGASPSFVTLPATNVLLSVAATDTERDALTYAWTVKSKPESASTFLGSPTSTSTVVTGVSVPGTYVFTVTIRDTAGNATARDVTVRAYQGNQPPVIEEGNRFYKQEWIVQPRSSAVYGPLFINAFDLEGDPVTTSLSVVQQPPGANATFSGTTVSGMTVAGDYTFRFTASDPTHTVFRDFTRRVVPAQPAPVPVPGCRFELNSTSLALSSAGGAGAVAVSTTTGCGWTATAQQEWISITSAASGSGNGSVTFSVLANTGGARLGAIAIAGQTFTIAQSAPTTGPCFTSLTPTSQSLGAGAGAGGPIMVTTGAGCAWTATARESWISITSPASTIGNGTVTFNVSANSGEARAGAIEIAGHIFTVTQAAASSGCSASISPASQFVDAGTSAGRSVSVTAAPGCAWAATAAVEWITITSGATGNGNGLVLFTVWANAGPARTGTISVAGRLHTVSQAAAAVEPSLSDSASRRRTRTAELTGRAVARGSDRAQNLPKGSSQVQAPSAARGPSGPLPGGRILRVPDLAAILTSLVASDEAIKRIQVTDLDEDGKLDVVIVELIDGTLWHWQRR
jgi:O-glycosyl hydrolase